MIKVLKRYLKVLEYQDNLIKKLFPNIKNKNRALLIMRIIFIIISLLVLKNQRKNKEENKINRSKNKGMSQIKILIRYS